MKKLILIATILASLQGVEAHAQSSSNRSEEYGRTLNLGVGIGYYSYVGAAMPVLHFDYEIGVARNFTLAPFIGYYSYTQYYYWGNPNYPFRDYRYRETVVPIGVKGTYYFDQLLGLNSKWDLYLAGSVGFAIVNTTWDEGYYGDRTVAKGASPLYINLHMGTEYHITRKAGLFLDLSTGVSSLGLALHM